MEHAEVKRLWAQALEELTTAEPGGLTKARLNALTPLALQDGNLILGCPDEFTVAELRKLLYNQIKTVASQVYGSPVELTFTILETQPQLFTQDLDFSSDYGIPLEQIPVETPIHQLIPQPQANKGSAVQPIECVGAGQLRANYTFDNFVMGHANRMAYSGALSVAEQPGATYNPLLIYGPSGLGKTHLLHAIGHYIMNNTPHMRVLYVTTEGFTNDFINALRNQRINEFHEQYRGIDVLLIDDIQEVEGKEATQQEFFQTFNHLHLSGKQIVLTSDRHPNKFNTLTERLQTRFSNGLICDVGPPDLETRITILLRICEREHRDVPRDALEAIARRASTNVRSLEGALTRVVANASINNLPITLNMVEDLLRDAFPLEQTRRINAATVMYETANYYEISVDDINGRSRTREIVNARHVAMYLTRELTDLSLPEIGKRFGGRDHSTVKHGYDRVKALLDSNPNLFQDIQELTAMIQNSRHQ